MAEGLLDTTFAVVDPSRNPAAKEIFRRIESPLVTSPRTSR